jgi:hypothetical protein
LRQLWVAYVAPPLPPSAARGLLLLLAALAATGAGEGAGSRRCRAAGRCGVHLGRGMDFGARKRALFVRFAQPSSDRFAPQKPLRAPIGQANRFCGARPHTARPRPARTPPARAYGAQPRPQLPAVGPRAQRATATSHGRGWAATVAPCKPPTASADNQRRRPTSPVRPGRARAHGCPEAAEPLLAGPCRTWVSSGSVGCVSASGLRVRPWRRPGPGRPRGLRRGPRP